ncbi:MAG TPA: hypothetical protein DHU96_24290 [Actinobacteria bacterium]|nr:hypothetical protein [Actinomycetota bacterium]
MNARLPGHDEITLTAPQGRCLCNDRQHRTLGTLAEVIVTFGQLGVPGTPRDAFWPECWGRSYPMCSTCWETTRQIAAKARPHLVIKDLTQ